MYLLLCYDVTADTRRARLFKRLKGFLRPVQKSVFEGELPDRRWSQLTRVVEETIDPRADTVRVYHLCRTCRGLILLAGTAEPLPDPSEPVVIG